MATSPDLLALGLDERVLALAAAREGVGELGRVIRSDRGFAFVVTGSGLRVARPATRLVKDADEGGLPVVGDWVVVSGGDDDEPLVEDVLERMSAIMRRDPGRASRVQVLAANIDTVVITHPIDSSAKLGRIERELALVWDSGARPVIALTKADLAVDADAEALAVSEIAPGVPVHTTSTVTGAGLEDIRAHLGEGRTLVLIGPSGSGKSTLVNALAGEDIQATREVRMSDGRGRHTTVSRELITVPTGGAIIDTPGLRAVGMWDSSDGLDQAFADIAELASDCRFRDCTHDGEPGCAVEAAVASGELPERRLESYRELQAEIRHVNEELDVRARQERKQADKRLARDIRRFYRSGGRS